MSKKSKKTVQPSNFPTFPREIPYPSTQFMEFIEFMSSRKGVDGLSFCKNCQTILNTYYKRLHVNCPKSMMVDPKDFVDQASFLILFREFDMIKNNGTILHRPKFWFEEELFEEVEQIYLSTIIFSIYSPANEFWRTLSYNISKTS